jgi:NADH dehydrogenase FAD-containing subunit
MLASTAVGTVEYRSIVENIRMANPHVNYFEGEAINIRDDEVEVMSTVSPEKFVFNVPYDFLVYSVGSQVADFGVPGVKEHCCFIKEIEDVKKIKNQIFKAFERASLPTMKADDIKRLLTFVVVGGGPTGVEFTGELSDFISEEVSRLYPMLKDKAKIILLNSASNILTAFDKVLQEKALSFLEERGIDMRLKTRVKAVTATSINYSSGEDAPLMELPYGLCVWAAGNACREITRTFATTLNPGQELSVKTLGRLSVDPFLRLLRNDLEGAYSNMFALGDVANIASGSLPQTAQVAAQQGAYLARLLNRGYNTSTSVPTLPANLWTADTMKALQVRGLLAARSFSFLNLGLLAYVGDSEAVAQIQLGDATIVDTAGTKAFLLWRSVYIVKQVSVRTRLLVIFDYIKTKLFGRDLTTL